MSFSTYLEQQAWTPTVAGSSVTGAGTYTTQVGFYTRIGNLIFLQAEITWSAHTGSGNMLINLPFPVANNANYSPEGIVNTINMPLPGGTSRTAIGSAQPSTSIFDVYVTTNAGANTSVVLPTSGTLHLTYTYLT